MRVIKQCECSDPGCSTHEGKSECTRNGTTKISRYDYETNGDHFLFCQGCAEFNANLTPAQRRKGTKLEFTAMEGNR